MKKRNQKLKSLKLNKQQVSNLNAIFGGVGTGTTAQSGATASKTGDKEPKKTFMKATCDPIICPVISLLGGC